ncbi:OmpA family protein [Solitalea lacus]|uniref:OmpA family protein n=1 Tax=Solitalea lacus TaxID=2911172 RepID=UPI0023EE4D46|nr:OmpA family protein [Solitalea lacus]
MLKRALYISIFIVCSGVQAVFAQASLREAQRQIELLNYNDAISLFEKAFNKKISLVAAKGLAESYRQLNNYQFTESWYAKVVQMDGHEPVDEFYYAEALRNNSKYGEAKSWYQFYKKQVGADAFPNIDLLIASCDSAKIWMQNPVDYLFQLDTTLNTRQSDWGAIPFKNGVVFTSDRIIASTAKNNKPILYFDSNNNLNRSVYGWTGLPYLKLFYAEKRENQWEFVPFSNSLNGNFHNGPACFSKDGKEVYFTRTRGITNSKMYTDDKRKRKDYTIKLELYSSKYDEKTKSWSEPKAFEYNSPLEYSVGDACLSADGKYLFFASDMPGGLGQSDLYYCKRKSDGSWDEPVNLKKINTPGADRFPGFDNKNNLYFASNGLIGLGGLDVFVAKSTGVNNWAEPKNMGYPVNTPQDDFNLVFAVDGKSGYLSSNRKGGVGMDDIYQFAEKVLQFRLEGTVVNRKTGKPLNNAIVTLYNQELNSNLKATTDNIGAFTFNLDGNSDYFVTAEKTNFITGRSAILSTKSYKESKTIYAKLALAIDSIELYKGIKLENIYYDFDKWDIRNDAATELNRLVQIMKDNPTVIVELGSHTDSRGAYNYNLKLSQKRAQSVVDYIISKGIEARRITAKGYGESKPVNGCTNGSNCTEDEFQLNRRTEFTILRY